MSTEDEGRTASSYYGVTSQVYHYLTEDTPVQPTTLYHTESSYVTAEEELKNLGESKFPERTISGVLNSIFDEMMESEIDPLEAQMHTSHKTCSVQRYDAENSNALVIKGFDSQQLKSLKADFESRRDSCQLWIHLILSDDETKKIAIDFHNFQIKPATHEAVLFFEKESDLKEVMNNFQDQFEHYLRIGFVSPNTKLRFKDITNHMSHFVNYRIGRSSMIKSRDLELLVKHSLHSIISSKETKIADEYVSACRQLNLSENRTYLHLSSVFEKFCTLLKVYGRVIINEYSLQQSEKTIKAVDVGGVAGGEKFMIK
jgi:hypothetical protein